MIVRLGPLARTQIAELEDHYEGLGRETAITRLVDSVDQASRLIEAGARRSLPAPRPYPELARYGARWLHVGRYWISFRSDAGGHVITSVHYDAADIPARISPGEV